MAYQPTGLDKLTIGGIEWQKGEEVEYRSIRNRGDWHTETIDHFSRNPRKKMDTIAVFWSGYCFEERDVRLGLVRKFRPNA